MGDTVEVGQADAYTERNAVGKLESVTYDSDGFIASVTVREADGALVAIGNGGIFYRAKGATDGI